MFRAWVGPMSDKEWKAFSTLIGDFEARSSPSMAEVVLRRGGIAVIADGEPKRLCPIWGEINASGRLEAVVSMEALVSAAARIPANHPANLAEAFPRPLCLNRYLVGTLSVALSVALAVGSFDISKRAQFRTEGELYRRREALLGDRLATLD